MNVNEAAAKYLQAIKQHAEAMEAYANALLQFSAAEPEAHAHARESVRYHLHFWQGAYNLLWQNLTTPEGTPHTLSLSGLLEAMHLAGHYTSTNEPLQNGFSYLYSSYARAIAPGDTVLRTAPNETHSARSKTLWLSLELIDERDKLKGELDAIKSAAATDPRLHAVAKIAEEEGFSKATITRSARPDYRGRRCSRDQAGAVPTVQRCGKKAHRREVL